MLAGQKHRSDYNAIKTIAPTDDGQTIRVDCNCFGGGSTMAKRSDERFPASASHTPLNNDMDKPLGRDVAPIAERKGANNDRVVENSMNLSLLDPTKFGWAALGGVGDLLPPHQVRKIEACLYLTDRSLQSARRRSSKRSVALSTRQKQRFGSKRARSEGALDGTASASGSFGYSVHSEPTQRIANGSNANVTMKPPAPFPYDGTAAKDDQAPLQRFNAVQGGTLHVNTYHRGIEGDEPRDQQTGELRFPTRPSETGLAAGGPSSLEVSVTIQFPLNDMLSTDLDKSNFFRQTVQWDLGNPSTPTPILYAGRIATEFGLSYTETLDLANSIQMQLQSFCVENCASAVPTLIKPGSCPKPTSTMCQLYGDTIGFASTGGFGIVQPRRPTPSTSQRSNISVSSKAGTKNKIEKDVSLKRKAPPAPDRSSDSTEKVFYRQVLSRLKRDADEFIKANWAASSNEIRVRDAGPGQCHLCHEHYEKCVLYPCGIQGHAVCEKHMLQKHGISLQSGSQKLLNCPICSLQCGCSVCNCKHSILAFRLKKMCLQQGAKPHTTHIHGIHGQCVAISMLECKEFLRTNGAMRNFLLRPQVPKISQDEFPREVIDGIELDLEYQEHYEMVFTSSGGKKKQREGTASLVQKDPPRHDASQSTPEKTEAAAPTGIDGNTDFCMKCNKIGSLVCCDVCPRAFHWDCVTEESTVPEDGKQWVCPSCISERIGLPCDAIDGSRHVGSIKSTYSRSNIKEGDENLLQLLSILLEMVEVLMNYDFGYMFCSPVDPKQVPGYDKIVKFPMDLGTIKTNILSGRYLKSLGDDGVLEDAVLAVLKDVELVWHNCLLFNVEGSAVYRMAGVLSRRVATMRQKNFDSMISTRIKDKLAEYIDSLTSERTEAKRLEPRPPASAPRNRHKVANCAKGAPQRRRPIVGLDPDTGMVAKLYSTMLSLSNAVNILVSMGVMCEYKGPELDNTNKLRTFVTRSASDPSIRLFGYRWLFLDELYERKVRFQDDMYERTNKPEDEFVDSNTETMRWGIAVQTADDVTYFRNLEEALSLINCRSDHNMEALERSLKVSGAVICDGFKVTKLADIHSTPEPLILKQDTVAGGRTLMGYSTIRAAFQDWSDAMVSSAFNYGGSVSIELFKEYYLGKGRSVDGMRYFMVPREEPMTQTTPVGAQTNPAVAQTVQNTPQAKVANIEATRNNSPLLTAGDAKAETASLVPKISDAANAAKAERDEPKEQDKNLVVVSEPGAGTETVSLPKKQDKNVVVVSEPVDGTETVSVKVEKPEIAENEGPIGQNGALTVNDKPPADALIGGVQCRQ